MSIRLLIADDHELVRTGLISLLSGTEIEIVGWEKETRIGQVITLRVNQKKMETVLVAAKKDVVQARVEVLDAVGLKPAIIDVDSFALENVYDAVGDADGDGRIDVDEGLGGDERQQHEVLQARRRAEPGACASGPSNSRPAPSLRVISKATAKATSCGATRRQGSSRPG